MTEKRSIPPPRPRVEVVEEKSEQEAADGAVVLEEFAEGEKEAEAPAEVRLEAPVRPKYEMKSKQPGVEAITDVQLPTAPEVEAGWGAEETVKKTVPWGWLVLMGLAVLAAVGWTIQHAMKADTQVAVVRNETDSLLDREKQADEAARAMVARIRAVVVEFCMAEDMETMLKICRHPERVRPLMEDHYSRHPLTPYGEIENQVMTPLTLGQFGGFWMASVAFKSGRNMNLIVEADFETEALVDWETAVCYQPMDWTDFATRRPVNESIDFRVYVEPSYLYSHEFADPEEWNSYKLTALGSENVMFGYVKAGSPSARLLQEWFERYPGQPAPMILNLVIPEGLSSPNGVVIDHAKSLRWIYVEPPHVD